VSPPFQGDKKSEGRFLFPASATQTLVNSQPIYFELRWPSTVFFTFFGHVAHSQHHHFIKPDVGVNSFPFFSVFFFRPRQHPKRTSGDNTKIQNQRNSFLLKNLPASTRVT
jgi:hypothetical protein